GTSASLLIRWQQVRSAPAPCWLLTLQDRGRRRSDPLRAQQQLSNQQQFMNQLIHEVRTPLAIASASLRRAAARSGDGQAPASGHLDVARQELKRITRLVDHLALLTDLDAQSQRGRPAAIPLGRLLENWYFELPAAARQRLHIRFDGGCEHHFLKLDAEAMAIVFNNLIDNSLRFSAADAPVLLLARLDACGVQLDLADWGPGIPVELRDRVFDRFHRLEQHRDPERADGSGLGLAVVRELLQQQQATIRLLPPTADGASPQAPGTVFRLQFACHGVVPETDRSPVDPELLAGSPAQLQAEGALRLWQQRLSLRPADAGESP
ncbi:MAG: sensor histidine kinase, partial [Prochlorococcaceae cyanobacterium]